MVLPQKYIHSLNSKLLNMLYLLAFVPNYWMKAVCFVHFKCRGPVLYHYRYKGLFFEMNH